MNPERNKYEVKEQNRKGEAEQEGAYDKRLTGMRTSTEKITETEKKE